MKIDGRDVRELQPGVACATQIGIVAQDTFLFNDTVANNIAYGRPGMPREAIRARRRNGAGARVHRAPAGRLRDRDRRPRRQALAAASGSASPSRARC